METTPEVTKRKRKAAGLSLRQRRARRQMLSFLREEVRQLHEAGLPPSMIARKLGIATWDARAFRPGPAERLRIVRAPGQHGPWDRLTDRVVRTLTTGRHAAIGGDSDAERVQALARIAAAYTVDELLEEPGIGQATTLRIELFLERHGLSFRKEDEPQGPGVEPAQPACSQAERTAAVTMRVMERAARHIAERPSRRRAQARLGS